MRRTPLLVVLFLIVLLAGFLAACGDSASTTTSAGTTAAADGATLLQARCTVCHSLDRVEAQQQSQEWWADTVGRMIGKGAQLSEEEKATLVAYLAATYGQ